jgi:hypothetical protein
VDTSRIFVSCELIVVFFSHDVVADDVAVVSMRIVRREKSLNMRIRVKLCSFCVLTHFSSFEALTADDEMQSFGKLHDYGRQQLFTLEKEKKYTEFEFALQCSNS